MSTQKLDVIQRRSAVSLLLPFVVVAVGVLVLVGWLLDIAVLKSGIPSLTAMNPMTAVAFILASLALWMLSTARALRFAPIFALIVLLIALLKLADIVFGWDIGVDRLLFADKLQADSVPNRMAPNTALCFLLVGAALYLTSRKSVRWSRVAQALTLLAVLMAFFAVIGYVYTAPTFYGVLTYIPMAFPTAVTFIVLCIGTLSVQPDVGVMAVWRSRTPGGVLTRRLLPLSAFVLLLTGWLQFVGVRDGVFNPAMGQALFAIVNVILLVSVVWRTAQFIDRADRERRHSEAALGESEARYRALFENSSDAILVVDSQGRLFNANPAMERLSGYSRDELLSAHIGDLVPDVMTETGQKLTQTLNQGKNITGEYAFVRLDGSEIIIEFTAVRIAPGLYQSVIHDISERKKVEENLRLSIENERQLNELKTRFVSMVSHEFRTPLAVVRSSTDLLLHYDDRLDAEKRRQRLERIQLEITLMVQMLDDILIIRKAEQVGVEFSPELLDLRQFCADLIAEIQPAVSTHQIVFTSGGDCTQTLADPRLLRQVLTNLISNAVKYSPGREQVRFEIACGEQEIVMRIEDEGIGIPEADQERLFEAFHRAQNVAGIPGTGLGLPIVKQAVEAHGGTISLASEVNVGTTFIISIPRRLVA